MQERAHIHNVKVWLSDGTACRNLQKSLQIYPILMTEVDWMSHWALTHRASFPTVFTAYVGIRISCSDVVYNGTPPWSRGEFWINTALYKIKGSSHKWKGWKNWQIKFIDSCCHLLHIHACTFPWEMLCILLNVHITQLQSCLSSK